MDKNKTYKYELLLQKSISVGLTAVVTMLQW